MFGNLGESEIEKKIREMEATEERLVVYDVDVLDYQSILVSLKTCYAVFCCLDSPEGYDVSVLHQSSFIYVSWVLFEIEI